MIYNTPIKGWGGKHMNKNLRKEGVLGILLAGLWLLLKVLPRNGLIMSLLLVVAAALIVVGLLPDALYQQVKDSLRKLLGKK